MCVQNFMKNVWVYVYKFIVHECTCNFSGNCHTGWRRPIGCLGLQVIFRKRATNYRALLQKITYKDKASYGSSPLSYVHIVNKCTHNFLNIFSHIKIFLNIFSHINIWKYKTCTLTNIQTRILHSCPICVRYTYINV